MMKPGALLAELIAELGSLGRADRRQILGRFDAGERKLIEHWLERAEKREPPSFDALAGLSPWLAESLAAARGTNSGMTLAAREALVEAERLLPAGPDSRPPRARSIVERFLVPGARR